MIPDRSHKIILTKYPTTIADVVNGTVKILRIPNPTASTVEKIMKLCGQSSTGRVGCSVIGMIGPGIPICGASGVDGSGADGCRGG